MPLVRARSPPRSPDLGLPPPRPLHYPRMPLRTPRPQAGGGAARASAAGPLSSPITSLPARFSGPHADLYGQCRVTALRGRSLSSFEGVRGPQVGDGVWKGSHRGELPGAGRCVSPRSPCGHRFSRLLPLGAHGEAGPGCWSPSSGSSCSDIWPVLGTEQKLSVPWRWAWPPCGSVARGELPNLSGSPYLENRRSGQD